MTRSAFISSKYGRLLVIAGILLTAAIAASAAPFITLVNPYEGMDWSALQQHKANLHTHTTQSDGSHNPDVVIDFYHSRGYSILAFTDHNRCTYPWQTWGRDPEALGMLAIPGNEYSRHDHLNGFFLCHETTSNTVEQTMDEIAAQGGIAHLNHPGRYWSPDNDQVPPAVLDKYVTWYSDYPPDLLVGMEVFNSINRYPEDILLWDALLEVMMPERPIWIFANDDMHYINVVNLYFAGIAWTVFPTNDLSETTIRNSMVNGQFYASTFGTRPNEPLTWNATRVPVITDIVHDAAAGEITISAVSSGQPLPEEDYLWISGGAVVATGSTLAYRNTPGIHNYVRAQLEGVSGTTFLNPFGVLTESGTLSVFIGPPDAVYAGAKWSIDNGATWHESGDEIELAPANYTITFSRANAYRAPEPIVATVYDDEATVVTWEDGAEYVYDPSMRLPVSGPVAMLALIVILLAGGSLLALKGKTKSSRVNA